MVALRDYQMEMMERLHDAWRRARCVMVQMPTGTGKTVLLAEVIRSRTPNTGVLIVAHRRELLEQIKGTVASFGIDMKQDRVFVESIQKLSKHIGDVEWEPKLVVIDEAHHALAKTYRTLFERWPKVKFLGLTATPCRLNGTAFTDLFDVMLQAKDIQWFIQKGWLSDFEYVSVRPDSEEMKRIRGLRKRGADGDYQTKEMATVMDVPESIEHLYDTYHLYTRGKKGIVYAIDRAHAQHIAEYYSAHGVKACRIDANTPAKEREKLVEDYRKGKVDVIVNVDIFSEGFDCPEVEFIQLARPTLSLAKYLQQVGRGMRVTKGKPYVTILDNVGLYQTFGLPTENRDWQRMFLGKDAGKGTADGDMRPLIIRDEVADKQLVNLEMLHIKRFNERRTRLEVFLQNGRFGVMCMGHMTCSPQFRRVQRLHHSRYFAMAVYDNTEKEYTTVIDNEGRNMRLAFPGSVTVKDDIFIYEDEAGKKMYYDAVGKLTYYRIPQFRMVAGLEVQERMDAFYLRDGKDKLVDYLSKKSTHYNDYIVITYDTLINKADSNRQSKIQAYLEDSVLVTAYKDIGYQQIHTDGTLGRCFQQMPQGATTVPDWERLGLQTLSAVGQEGREERLHEKLMRYYDLLVKNMVNSYGTFFEDLLGYGFQIIHEGHTAGKEAFIKQHEVRFLEIKTLSHNMESKGNTATITGQQEITYSRHNKHMTEVYNFRMTMKSINGIWKISRLRYWKGNRKQER